MIDDPEVLNIENSYAVFGELKLEDLNKQMQMAQAQKFAQAQPTAKPAVAEKKADDDEDGEANNNLTTYRFLLGDEEGQQLEITSPGTTIFVNKNGDITWKGKSSVANDEQLILEQWEIANQD